MSSTYSLMSLITHIRSMCLDSTSFEPKVYDSFELPQEDSLQKPESLDLKD